jgi:hypothetical protein
MMNVNLGKNITFELFDLEQASQLITLAIQMDQEIYTFKTAEHSNWLERGIHIVDELGLVLLPKNFPDNINLPDDNPNYAL